MPVSPGLTGLTDAEVSIRRAEYGPNLVPAAPPPGPLRRTVAQLRDPLILLLLASMMVTIGLGDVPDTIVIGLVIVLNTTVGVVQEIRADNAVAALRQLASPTARVVRAGFDRVVPASDLVPGDVVRLESGDIIPADIRLAEAVRFSVNESALTGESEVVDKNAADELYAGTVAATGRAVGVVTRVGALSALGRIAALVAGAVQRATPLQHRLVVLGRVLAAVTVALAGVVFVAGLARGLPLPDMVLSAVSLVVAAVPESLPAVVTVALALGAHRMARRSAIVRRLPAVETLGSVTIVATDKTGTLTEGIMSVRRLIVDNASFEVHGSGYEPSGRVEPASTPLARQLARAAMLCADADVTAPESPNGEWVAAGDPMEAALVAAAARCGVDLSCRREYPRVAEIPFDASRRRMLTVHKTPDGDFLAIGKGAFEVMLTCTSTWLRDEAEALAHQGLRVLAVSTARFGELPGLETIESDLVPLGLIALEDPPRAEAHEALDRFAAAGMRLVVITGDHPHTAAAIAERLDLPQPPRILTGDQLVDNEQRFIDVDIFARTQPEQKLDIVAALQSRGHIVAMTGDGVNDAPALRSADIGVAMGKGGTEAARQAADLVLADDNLTTMAAAVEEGRRIYANIRRFLAYALSGGAAEIAVMLAGPWLGFVVPLLPAQILWINMITHGLPGVALGAEPSETGTMNAPPRPPRQAILGDGLAGRIALTAAIITVVTLTAAVVAAANGSPWQTVLFTVLGLGQLGVALASRSRRRPGTGPNRGLDAAVALSAALQIGALWLPPLRSLLGLEALTFTELAACALAAAIPGTALKVVETLRARASRPRRR